MLKNFKSSENKTVAEKSKNPVTESKKVAKNLKTSAVVDSKKVAKNLKTSGWKQKSCWKILNLAVKSKKMLKNL